MKTACLALCLFFAPALMAQAAVTPGTVLPVQLETGLNARHLRPGKEIHAKIMQNIPGSAIHRGATVLGRVVSVSPGRLQLRFDTLVVHGQRIPLQTNLRAIDSMVAVEEAESPESGPDRSLPPPDWTTQQIGGEQVYRGGGPVTSGLNVVATPTPNGVRGQLRSNPPCRAAFAGNDRPQALWLFSTDACGPYGFAGLSIEHSGRTAPQGEITLAARTGKLNIRSGSGLLLRVLGS